LARDTMESRVILLRRRLCEKCQEIAIVLSGRGKVGLRLQTQLQLIER
jgi:hypothetical protein